MTISSSPQTTSLSYKDAGVDIEAGDHLVDRIKSVAKRTMRPEVMGGLGGFGALCKIPKGYDEPVLVSGTDGVGTKLKLDWVQLLLVLVVFMIGQAIEGYVLQPFLLGDKIGLSPVAVVFAVLAGAQLYGFVGMLVALPVAAVLVVLLRHAYHTYERSVFYMGYRQPASVKVPASSSELSETSITEQDVETHLTLQDDAPELGLHSPVLEHPANYSSSPLNHSSKHGNNGS